MLVKHYKTILCVAITALFPFTAIRAASAFPEPNIYPHDQKLYDQLPWMLTYYYGITGDNALLQMMVGQFNRWPEHIQAAELADTLDEDNFFRRFFNPIVGVVQLAGIITVRSGTHQHTIYEFDPYIAFRWANLPWNDYVTTSLAIGEGVSYASSVPYIEKIGNDNVKRFLNFVMVEATFAVPAYPQLQLLARIHHRSGAFGLYQADNSGSNAFSLGIRYLFA